MDKAEQNALLREIMVTQYHLLKRKLSLGRENVHPDVYMPWECEMVFISAVLNSCKINPENETLAEIVEHVTVGEDQ